MSGVASKAQEVENFYLVINAMYILSRLPSYAFHQLRPSDSIRIVTNPSSLPSGNCPTHNCMRNGLRSREGFFSIRIRLPPAATRPEEGSSDLSAEQLKWVRSISKINEPSHHYCSKFLTETRTSSGEMLRDSGKQFCHIVVRLSLEQTPLHLFHQNQRIGLPMFP